LFRQIDRALEDRRQGWFELADFVGIEDVDLDAVLATEPQAISALGWPVGRFVDEELAALLQQVLAAGGLDQRLVALECVAVQRAHRR
jgi:hypothetical protein